MDEHQVTPGRPVRLELNSQRVTTAIAFYQALLGWRSIPLHVAPWGSIPQIANGDRIFGHEFMAMGAFSQSRWITWFSADLERAEEKIPMLGGDVGKGIYRLGNLGRVLDASDPDGSEFALICLDVPAPELDVPGDPCIAELWGHGVARLADFYADVLGLDKQATQRGAVLSYSSQPRLFLRDSEFDLPRPCWIPYFCSSSVGADCERARRLGAIVQVEAEFIEDIGELVILADPGGGFFGLVDTSTNSAHS